MEENKIVIYQTENGQTQIDVRLPVSIGIAPTKTLAKMASHSTGLHPFL